MASSPDEVMTLTKRIDAYFDKKLHHNLFPLKPSPQSKEFKMLTDDFKQEVNPEPELSWNLQKLYSGRGALIEIEINSVDFPNPEKAYELLGKRVALARFNHCKSLVTLLNEAMETEDFWDRPITTMSQRRGMSVRIALHNFAQ